MFLTALQARNFRNYAELAVEFSPGFNVLFGDNGQGKTNLLEALYFLATGKSHRASRDQELIRHGERGLRIRGQVVRQSGTLDLEVVYGRDIRKSLKINGMPEKRIATLVGKLAVVFFSPDDLMLVKGAPAGRRRFLDIELSQLSPTYLHHLQVYIRLLSQRNALLRQVASGHGDPGLLDILDQQLTDAGAYLVARRVQAIERLASIAAEMHLRITEGKEHLGLFYSSRLAGTPDGRFPAPPEPAAVRACMATLLREYRREEFARATTLVGPHRDDFVVLVNGQDGRIYGSQGQQRTAVLSLKLAELQFMREQLGEFPVLLLDDVSSELDPTRRHYLIHAFQHGVQTFVSCTHLGDLAARTWPADHRLFRVCAGTVHVAQGGLG